MILTLYRATMT